MSADHRLDLRALLEAIENAPPTAGVEALAAEMATVLGAAEVGFLIADIISGSLARLARSDGDGEAPRDGAVPESVPIEGTAAGRALRTQQVQLVAAGSNGSEVVPAGLPAGDVPEGAVWVFAPVTERGEAVGVLELLLPTPPDPSTLSYVEAVAHALAYVVIADRRYTDLYEFGARSVPLSLAAEMQRRLLPASYTCETGQFALSGWLVPANDVGGDTFDFALDRHTLHLSITDAMGHGVLAAQLATLTVGSLRNSRRGRAGVLEQAGTANDALHENADPDELVTGLLMRVELATGAAEVVNAGHEAPLLIRAGQVTRLDLQADLPFGVLPGASYRLQHALLEPGDRLVLLTDGMLERNAVGAHIAHLLPTISGLHPREAVQALTGAVQHITGGELLDDATVLVVDWYGGPDQSRGATAGATRSRASG